ncbi:MAG: primosomal protein N' [Syntrophobacteraceae bacterium]
MDELFAEIAIFGALDKTLHYRVPPHLHDAVRIGARAMVPLGRREAMGMVVALQNDPPATPSEISFRPILAMVDKLPLLPADLLRLCRWVSKYYYYPLGEVLQTVIPSGGNSKKVKLIKLLSIPDKTRIAKSDHLRRFIELIEESGGTLPMKVFRQNVKNAGYWVEKLKKEGVIEVQETEEVRESPFAQALAPLPPHTLTPDQDEVLSSILPFFKTPGFQPFVLFGITGSGKTEIYLQLVRKALDSGKGALILVPEIAISTQMEALFRQRFGSRLAVWHSALSLGSRHDQWKETLTGKKKVILGVRSAVFMPVSDLGLIIVDEEHDSSYKQDDHLRYHARDVALMRASNLGIPIVLGSATPSLQSVQQCRSNRYRLLSLPSRINDRPLPSLEIVDMRRESRRNRILSERLQKALAETIDSGQQALIFLNRRGFATFFLCTVCGNVLQCDHCTVSLTYHRKEDLLRCHYCNWERKVPKRCPSCDNETLISYGFGTERVEEEIKRLLPGEPIVRIDRDTVRNPRHIVEYFNAVRQEKAKILLGTQMIAKGHDFPNITLVGIINADAALQVPDFRACETTVQLLMQVSGRAGRGEVPGRAILQTYNPDHYTIRSVLDMDYLGFCSEELATREALQYPPFAKLLRLLVTGADNDTTRKAAFTLTSICRETAESLRGHNQHVAILGPSPAPLTRLSNRFRWHVFAKAWTNRDLQGFSESVLDRSKHDPLLRGVQIVFDRDPLASL